MPFFFVTRFGQVYKAPWMQKKAAKNVDVKIAAFRQFLGFGGPSAVVFRLKEL
jgi:hypothetical protein